MASLFWGDRLLATPLGVCKKINMERLVRYEEISSDVKNEIDRFTSNSTVAILGYDEHNNPIDGLLASGTFVIINSIYGILTARHVWEKLRLKSTYTSFCIIGKIHYLRERTKYLRCYIPNEDVDICFIEIPPRILGTISAVRNFHPILPKNFSGIESIKNLMWITVGFPYLIQKFKTREIHIFRYYTHIRAYKTISDDWDIIELDIQTENVTNKLPKSFGGMSGGGIWNFRGFYNDDSGEVKYFIKYNLRDALLAGVNFRQEYLNDKVYKICGVGPASIYSGMTKLVQ